MLSVGSGGEVEKEIRLNLAPRHVSLVTSDIDPGRNPAVVDDLSRSAFAENSFDYVFVIEVFEHIQDPFKASQELMRILRPGGCALITTPFIFMIHDAPYDFYRFTEYGLRRLLMNYADVEVHSRGTWFDAIAIMILRLPLTKSRFARLVAIILLPIGLVIHLLMKFISYGTTVSLITPGYITYARKARR